MKIYRYSLKERLKIPLMVLPSMAVIVLLFGGGLVFGLLQSLGYLPVAGLTDFTFSHYVNVLTDLSLIHI